MQLLACHVLKLYPARVQGLPVPLGNHGGFSGARLWRIDSASGAYCLKAWPSDARTSAELRWIHRLMSRAAGLAWMPHVTTTTSGDSFIAAHGRVWEMATWMPGQADFASAPTTARLESACAALAHLHVHWAATEARVGICPGVERRWQSWRAWTELVQSGWRPTWSTLDPFAELTEPLFRAVQVHRADVPLVLTPWLAAPLPLQPCVCDPWHDHILYIGAAVTGLIDFGSVKIDHVAVDLARLLGSLVGADEAKWQIGFNSYRLVRPLADADCRLARDLDRTGTIVAATHWLRWLYHENRRYDQPGAVTKRLRHLATRLSAESGANP